MKRILLAVAAAGLMTFAFDTPKVDASPIAVSPVAYRYYGGYRGGYYGRPYRGYYRGGYGYGPRPYGYGYGPGIGLGYGGYGGYGGFGFY